MVKRLPAMRETSIGIPGLARSPGEGKGSPLQHSGLEKSMDCIVPGVTKSRTRLSNFHFGGVPAGSDGKESTCSVEDLDSVPGLRRSSGEGKGYTLQYSGLGSPMELIAHGVAKSRTRLSDFHFHSA